MGKSKKSIVPQTLPPPIRIYAICNVKTKVPVRVGLDFEEIDFEYELEGYDEKEYAIMSFDVVLV